MRLILHDLVRRNGKGSDDIQDDIANDICLLNNKNKQGVGEITTERSTGSGWIKRNEYFRFIKESSH
ncbi:hypothetical protein KSF78_0002156 [Schistosoma japonicum]|nr:hypothetical protein KSF78_0002156 [Schistosoma japonicum]